MNEKTIKKLKNDTSFQQFQGFIIEVVEALRHIDDLKDLDNQEAGEIARIRALTASKLMDILSPFVDFNKKRKPTDEEIEAAKKRFGL